MKSIPIIPSAPVQLYATASYPCSYLPQRQAKSQVAAPRHLLRGEAFTALIQAGFRRSGAFVYRPQCERCQSCIPLRVDANQFQPARIHRRVWRKHSGLSARILPLGEHEGHFQLYRRYQLARHAEGDMAGDSPEQYREFLLTSDASTRMVEFRDGSGTLKMVCVIDVLSDGLSAVYTFYDPNDKASYGTYGVLWQIDQARQLQLPWVYLGYWIEQSPKMAYKIAFEPHQLLVDGRWR